MAQLEAKRNVIPCLDIVAERLVSRCLSVDDLGVGLETALNTLCTPLERILEVSSRETSQGQVAEDS